MSDPKQAASAVTTQSSFSIPTPEEIRGADFSTVRRGYDPERVREFLDTLALWFEWYRGQLSDAEARARRAEHDIQKANVEPKSEAQAQLSARARVRELVRNAEAEVDRVLKESHALLEEARSRAEAIREREAQYSEAKEEADQELPEARRHAAEIARESGSDANLPAGSLDDLRLAREYADVLLEAGRQLDASLASIQERLSRSVEQQEGPPTAADVTATAEEPQAPESRGEVKPGPEGAGEALAEERLESATAVNLFDEQKEVAQAEAAPGTATADEEYRRLFDERQAQLDTDLKSLRELFIDK